MRKAKLQFNIKTSFKDGLACRYATETALALYICQGAQRGTVCQLHGVEYLICGHYYYQLRCKFYNLRVCREDVWKALSEDYILVEGENGLYVMDRVSGYSPTRIVPEDYSMEYNEKHDFTYPFQNNDCSFINGNGIYDFSISWVYNPSSPAVVVTVLNVSQGDVSFEGVEFFPVNTTPENYGPYLEKVYTGMLDGKNAGIFVVNTAYVSGLFYYALDNGTPEVKFIPFEGTDRTAAYFRVNGSRVYWIGGENDNANGSYIRYYDFSTMNEGSFKIPGKPAASSDFSISDNGTVIYWQYLDDIQVGTYSWNPDKESYPTLIMTTDGDVHSMVNVSTL